MIYNVYFEDIYKSKRPSISLEKELEIVAKITIDWYKRKKSIPKIAGEVQVSQRLVPRIFKKNGYQKVKLI